MFRHGRRRAELLPGGPQAPRTQPAVSQAIRRLETAAGERLIDRSSRDGTLTDAGELLLDYAARLLRLADEAGSAVADLRDVRKGRVLIGANEAASTRCCRSSPHSSSEHPTVLVEVRRIPPRQMAQEVLLRTVDFGVLTFNPPERELLSLVIGTRRARAARQPVASARRAEANHDGRDGAAGGDRAQRSLAGARARAAAVRTAARAAEHPHLAAESRRHQARGRDGTWGRAAAAPLRAGRDRARRARRGARARAALAAAVAIRLSARGRAFARGARRFSRIARKRVVDARHSSEPRARPEESEV